jgi:hypothetical protein
MFEANKRMCFNKAIRCTGKTGQRLPQRRTMYMRSELIFGALAHVSNRYQLCQLASKATRKLHKPNSRLQDTTNEVFFRFRKANPGMALPLPPTANGSAQPAQAAPSIEQRRAA